MLIVSNFHDFYDRAVAHGVDKKTVFNRLQKKINNSTAFSSSSGWRGRGPAWENFWIGFCGRWYFGRKETTPYKSPLEPSETKFWYGRDAVERAYPDQGGYWGRMSLRHSILRDHGKPASLDSFIDNDTPTLAVNEGKLVVNPRLADFQFQKVVSPYEAFQSIEMFITNELAKQIDPAPLSDKDRIKAHGFDKWSFRRDTPPKRKQK